MSRAAWLLPTLPALAALLGLLTGRRLPRGPGWLHVAATGATFALSLVLLAHVLAHPSRVVETSAPLAPTGGLSITLGTRVDGLAAVVAAMVCAVALLVQIYSTGYLRGDPRYSSYAAIVSLFTAAMLLVVLAADLIELLVGWEVMGICSYFLIGHHWEQPIASAAAVKAFLMTRLGDVGFLFGLFTLATAAGSFRITTVLAHPYGRATVTVGTLLLLCGVIGKSAQFPLHTWLPDAMAGPTPISALIHAATMVAAGVYVVARLYPVFVVAPTTLDVLGIVASITMLLGALVALVHDDLKKVLAWSTVSQLAYMFAGLAVGGYTAGVYHLLTHAAFKALLFLAAGSVIHVLNTNSMSDMGGLRRAMPVTFVAMVVGAGALAGLPPLSGAFSKDAILAVAYDAGFGAGAAVPVSPAVAGLVWVVGVVTVAVTAAYATRLVLRVFCGPYRGTAVAHESPRVMTGPLVVLALAAALLGLLALPGGLAGRLADPVPGTAALHVALRPILLALALVVAAGLLVFAAHRAAPEADPARLLGRVGEPLRRGLYLDEVYAALVVRPVSVVLTGAALRTDDRAVDGVVDGLGSITRLAGAGLRRLQNGNVQAYATGVVLGVLMLTVAVALR